MANKTDVLDVRGLAIFGVAVVLSIFSVRNANSAESTTVIGAGLLLFSAVALNLARQIISVLRDIDNRQDAWEKDRHHQDYINARRHEVAIEEIRAQSDERDRVQANEVTVKADLDDFREEA